MPGPDVPAPEAEILTEELLVAEAEIRRLEDVLQQVGPLAGALWSHTPSTPTLRLALQGIEEACVTALR